MKCKIVASAEALLISSLDSTLPSLPHKSLQCYSDSQQENSWGGHFKENSAVYVFFFQMIL